MATKTEEQTGVRDLTALEKKAQDELDNPLDKDGNRRDTPAQAELAAEMSHRAAGSAEGGGPWPADMLDRYLTPPTSLRTIEPYTSHEEE